MIALLGRRRVAGFVGLTLIVVVIGGLWGVYQKTFVDVVELTVRTERIGLQLDPGAPVRVSGVTVGEVRRVEAVGDQAEVEIAIAPEHARKIPRDSRVTIRATTVFGTKFVDLDTLVGDRAARSSTIADGDTLDASATTREVNDVFQNTLNLLDALEPRQLNSTLTAVATALDGRGYQLGEILDAADAYLTQLNPHLDKFGEDAALVAEVADEFRDVTPIFVAAAENFTVTAESLQDVSTAIKGTLLSVAPAADVLAMALDSFSSALSDVSQTLQRPSAFVQRMLPQLGCTLDMVTEHNRFKQAVGNLGPWLELSVNFLPGQDPYKNPLNLPELVADDGPVCFEMPKMGTTGFKHIRFKDGSPDVYDDTSPFVDINTQPITVYEGLVKAWFGEAGLLQLLGGSGVN